MSVSPLLAVEDLSVRISLAAGELNAVSNVSFSVMRGETLCFVGESGCGKTMTSLAVLRLLPKAARFSAKRVLFEDRDVTAANERGMARLRGKRIGMIFQDPMTSMNPVYTIGNQLEEVYLRHIPGSRRQARERAEYLLSRVGIMSPRLRLAQYPHELSGGLRQRMMIAMALICEPTLIIADEPTTALDVTVQVQILQLLVSLQREFGSALILITHSLGVVARVADRVAVMYGGRIVETGPTEAIFAQPRHPYTHGLLACLPSGQPHDRHARLQAIPGTVPSLIGETRGCEFRSRCPQARAGCAADIPVSTAEDGHLYRCVLPPGAIPPPQSAIRAGAA